MSKIFRFNGLDDSDRENREDMAYGRACVRGIFYILALFAVLFVLSLFCTSCKTTKPGTVVVVRDSIRTEVHTETVYVHDTVAAPLPKDSIVIATRDTSSHIETSVAISEAAICDGLLWHSIWNKPSVDVPVEHKETVRDSIVYREKEVPVPYPVTEYVEKDLSWWQRTRLGIANIALIAAGLWLVWFFIKKRSVILTVIKALIQRW